MIVDLNARRPLNKLVALTGQPDPGKDAVARHLVYGLGYNRLSFSERIRRGLKAMFDLPDDQIFGGAEHEGGVVKDFSKMLGRPVTVQQLTHSLGTEWGREKLHPDIWLMLVAKQHEMRMKIKGYSGTAIPDLRFDNEAKWVASQGGLIIEVESSSRGAGSPVDRSLISGSVLCKKGMPIRELHDAIEYAVKHLTPSGET